MRGRIFQPLPACSMVECAPSITLCPIYYTVPHLLHCVPSITVSPIYYTVSHASVTVYSAEFHLLQCVQVRMWQLCGANEKRTVVRTCGNSRRYVVKNMSCFGSCPLAVLSHRMTHSSTPALPLVAPPVRAESVPL